MDKPTKEMHVANYIKQHPASELAAYATVEALKVWTPKALLADKYGTGFAAVIKALLEEVDYTKVKDALLMETLEKVAEQ